MKKHSKILASDSSANPKLAAASQRRLTRGDSPALISRSRRSDRNDQVSQRVEDDIFNELYEELSTGGLLYEPLEGIDLCRAIWDAGLHYGREGKAHVG